jgi:hypothetical protein
LVRHNAPHRNLGSTSFTQGVSRRDSYWHTDCLRTEEIGSDFCNRREGRALAEEQFIVMAQHKDHPRGFTLHATWHARFDTSKSDGG